MQLYQIPNEVTVILEDQTVLTITNTKKPYDPQTKTGGYTITAPYRYFGNYPNIKAVNEELNNRENYKVVEQVSDTYEPQPKFRLYDETWDNPEKLLEFIKKLENTKPTGMAHSLSICTALSCSKKRLQELEKEIN